MCLPANPAKKLVEFFSCYLRRIFSIKLRLLINHLTSIILEAEHFLLLVKINN